MKRSKKITVGLFIFTGVLFLTAGLRDIFAPGFFNMSPRIPSTNDIILQFSVAVVFLAVAFVFSKIDSPDRVEKK